jgi:very-short-patch-repair endonuclease
MLDKSASLHGAFRREKAVALFGEQSVRSEVKNGVFFQPWRGVIVDRKRALDPLTRAAAALLLMGPDVALSHNTAVLLHGCTAAKALSVHVTVPYDNWTRSKSGLIIHHDRYAQGDTGLVQGLLTLCLEASLTELLCTETRWVALACLDQALSTRTEDEAEVFVADLAGRLYERDNRRGVRIAEALLQWGTRGVESPQESRLRLLILDAGFPFPQTQHPIHTLSGKLLYRLDMAWPEARICLEYDGYEAHEEQTAYDAERDHRMAERGWLTIRARKRDLLNPRCLFDELRQAFASRKMTLPESLG